ncbi:alcohol dehydrogenase [Scheffersomyces amazonensis]|uniref:alcohol dehydrogenase n=1 Tax=Scheffersomyces amazonensis TaxID=1078765 RepID=UPI00315DBBE2
MTSVGLCHTDITFGKIGDSPKILGHEGTGNVIKIGSKVTNAKVGDPVLLSFSSCNNCKPCKHVPGFCTTFNEINFGLSNDVFTLNDQKIDGKFFGQSSFSKKSVVNESSIVNVKDLNLDAETLQKFGPLGCGFLTGSGAVYKAGAAKKGESCVVYGLGGVGLAGIMAAKIAGCYPIIGVDINDKKLELSKELGATHIVKAGNDKEVHDKIFEITDGGADVSLESIGGPKFVQAAIDNAANFGRIVFVGFGGFEDIIQVKSFDFMSTGKTLIGCVEGNSRPQEFIPQLIEWHSQGLFPIEKLETFYKIEDFNKALADMKTGTTTKAILTF